MIKSYYKSLKELFKTYPFIKDVLIFALLIVGFHLFYRAWAYWWDFWPIHELITGLRDWLSDHVFAQSLWFNEHVLGYNITVYERDIIFPGHGHILINQSCSGFKQIMQFVFLMLVFPGPWKHKAWFIPLGILVVHLTNLFRVVGLSVVLMNWPNYWDFSHDNLFRPFFYFVMFLMWVWWVEKFRNRKDPKSEN